MLKLFTTAGLPQPAFLPMSKAEMDNLGWSELDILLVSGDAYIDHPSFAAALLGRLLVAHGFRTGIITQPAWSGPEALHAMGRPRLFAGVSAGAIDSMLAHYTAFRKKRSDDAYTPGGKAGQRPNRACIVYTNLLRRAFPGLPVILGGIEASLRRITHYDFWTNALRKPIILDAKADAVVYGMGERALVEIAQALRKEQKIPPIPGTVTLACEPGGIVVEALPSHEAMEADPKALMQATLALEKQVHLGDRWMKQGIGSRSILIAPPAEPLSTEEMDALYALPFQRKVHPDYKSPVPAEDMIRDSITSHRGCGGGCSFCTLALHQGRRIASRSRTSILGEVRRMTAMPAFKGNISDIGGPSANMWGAFCSKDKNCTRSSCMTPAVCPHFKMDQKEHLDLLRTVRRTTGIRSVRVASGVRFDLALKDMQALSGYLQDFVGGQLKIAPEHICDTVLALMRKPGIRVFEEFLTVFAKESTRAGKQQYVIPYLMSAFPGTTDDDMRTLHTWLRKRGWQPQQVQCFIPIPGAVATAMYFARITPQGKPIYVAVSDEERLRQHRILVPSESREKAHTAKHSSERQPFKPSTSGGKVAHSAPAQPRSPRKRRTTQSAPKT